MTSTVETTNDSGIVVVPQANTPFEMALGSRASSLDSDVVRKRRWTWLDRTEEHVFSESQDHLVLARAALEEFRTQSNIDPEVLRDRARLVFMLASFNATAQTIFRRERTHANTQNAAPEIEDFGIMLGILCGWGDKARPPVFMSAKYHEPSSSTAPTTPTARKYPPRYGIVMSYWYYIAKMIAPEFVPMFSAYKNVLTADMYSGDVPESYEPYDVAYRTCVAAWKDSHGLTTPYEFYDFTDSEQNAITRQVNAHDDLFWDTYFNFAFVVLLNTALCQVFNTSKALGILPSNADAFMILSDVGLGAFKPEHTFYNYHTKRNATFVGADKVKGVAEVARQYWSLGP